MNAPSSNLAYIPQGDPAQTLDITLPKTPTSNGPLLVFIHGGAWISGDKIEYAALAQRFADDGIAVATMNYRLSTTPTLRHPAHVQDAAAAYSWLVGRAASYRYSPEKIFVMGHSAGAHNAAMMATGDYLSLAGVKSENLPKGFIGLEGIYDIPQLVKTWPAYREWFIEKAFGKEADWPDASPTLRPLTLKAPWLVVHSAKDELVDLGQSRAFAKHLTGSGLHVDLNDHATGSHDEVVKSLSLKENPVGLEIVKFIRGQ